MKIYKTLITASLALVCLIFASCADSDPTAGTGNTTIKSFPMTEGSYWITENYVTDQDDQLTGDVTIDSTVVGGTVVKAGKTGILFLDYSLDEQNVYKKSGETIYRTEDDKLYYFGNLLDKMIDLPIDLPGLAEDEWLNLIDFNSSIWEVARIEITEDDGNIFTAEMDMIGRSSNNSKDFVISGKTVNAQEYIIDIEGQFEISALPIPISFDRKMHIWFAESVGLVQQYLEPASIMDQPNPGEMKNLIRYHIK
ncbi:MAG: hypothetical protein PF588_01610 [Candidatus Kapabacteria bacterium]|nr:hypothetical protein [Candidatus Kapabacteria bacterium]